MKNVTPLSDAELNVGYVLLSAIGFASLLIGVSNMSSGSVLKLMSGGLMLIGVIFLFVFSRLQLTSKKPMLNLRVFKEPSFLIAVVISVCLYLISMGNGMILPIFTKSICGFSDSAYGYATLVGSILSVFATMYSGKVYDKMGIKGYLCWRQSVSLSKACKGGSQTCRNSWRFFRVCTDSECQAE